MLTCLFVINTYFVLEIFSKSLFAVSQSITFVISWLTEFCNFPRLLSLGAAVCLTSITPRYHLMGVSAFSKLTSDRAGMSSTSTSEEPWSSLELMFTSSTDNATKRRALQCKFHARWSVSSTWQAKSNSCLKQTRLAQDKDWSWCSVHLINATKIFSGCW